jgi:L-cysteine S-thiosulfotransferase
MKIIPPALLASLFIGLAIVGCTNINLSENQPDYRQAALDLMKADFKTKGPATLERMIHQDEAQRLCSQYPGNLPKEIGEKIERGQLNTIKYPADGRYLGDFKAGEAIAQNGRGMQSSDLATAANGGNCYACHQMSKSEISFGNIGPSLYQYGKLRGQSEEILKYTWGKIYNPQAYRACSNMPRFGHNGILQEKQIQDLMALLLDPASPVNQ